MDEHDDEQSPAAAFAALRGEVALLRRAVEGLAAARDNAPDYGPTIEALVGRQDKIAAMLKQLLATPAIQVTHAMYEALVVHGVEQRSAAERAGLQEARTALEGSTRRIASALGGARQASAQLDMLIWTAVLSMGGTAAALVIASLLLG